MPRGDKSKYTDKQKRKAGHIEAGYEHQGVPETEAERRAWATVNKDDGGGKAAGKRKRNAGGEDPGADRSTGMSEHIEQKIRIQAHHLWQEAGCPEGREEEFWHKARDMVEKKSNDLELDEAGEQSFPASDPVNHM